MERQYANNHRINGIIFSAISQHPMFKKYDLLMHNRDEQPETLLEGDYSQRDLLDGMIYSTPSEKHKEFFKHINTDIPLVLMGDINELHDSVICVDVDNQKMARQATEHLISIGRRNILLVIPEATLSAICMQERINGYRKALKNAGLPINPDLTRIISSKEKIVSEFVRTSPAMEKIDAILCLTDELAMLCMDPLEDRGLRIPEDIALMGFNGTDLFSEKAARLSTVKIPFRAMAYKATEKLLEVLEGKQPYTPGFYEVPTELVIRESTVK
jgi:DNA-binding LacI/PurR family transcriptional regulator